jgi:hypothetical protein
MSNIRYPHKPSAAESPARRAAVGAGMGHPGRQARVRVRLANLLRSSPPPRAAQLRESAAVPSTSAGACRAGMVPVGAK